MFQRDLRRRREQSVDVIGHDDEFVQEILSLIAIVSEGIDQKTGCILTPENWLAIGGNGRDKEEAVGVHLGMVVLMGERCL